MARDLGELIAGEILSDKTGRYRRNTLVIAAVAIGLAWIPGANLSEASFLNIRLGKSETREFWGHFTIAILLLYNFVAFAFYTQRDLGSWRFDLRQISGFHDLRMFFGKSPGHQTIKRQASLKETTGLRNVRSEYRWEADKHGVIKQRRVVVRFHVDGLDGDRSTEKAVPRDLYVEVRRKLREFLIWDCGIPTIPATLGAYFTLERIASLALAP